MQNSYKRLKQDTELQKNFKVMVTGHRPGDHVLLFEGKSVSFCIVNSVYCFNRPVPLGLLLCVRPFTLLYYRPYFVDFFSVISQREVTYSSQYFSVYKFLFSSSLLLLICTVCKFLEWTVTNSTSFYIHIKYSYS